MSPEFKLAVGGLMLALSLMGGVGQVLPKAAGESSGCVQPGRSASKAARSGPVNAGPRFSIMGKVLHTLSESPKTIRLTLARDLTPSEELDFSGVRDMLRTQRHDVPLSKSGEFQFPLTVHGSYTVGIKLNEVSKVTQRIEVGPAGVSPAETLVFDFRGNGSLMGRLLVPEGRSAASLKIGVLPAKLWDNPKTRYEHAPYFVEADAQGGFTFPSIPTGELVAFLRLETCQGADGWGQDWGAHPECGRVFVKTGKITEQDFSVHNLYPSEAKVSLSLKGDDQDKIGVTFILLGRKKLFFESFAPFDREKRATVKNLTPGTYNVVVRPTRTNSWTYVSPERITVGPASSFDLELDVQVITSKVSFLNRKTRKPLVDTEVTWSRRGDPVLGSFQTDATGSATLMLTAGKYQFSLASTQSIWAEIRNRRTMWPLNEASAGTILIR